MLELNDALFLDPSLKVERSYLENLKKWYGAGVEQTEFPDPALDQINGWVDDKTHGRIPQLLDQLDPLAVVALVNTIYLNAKWQDPRARRHRGRSVQEGGDEVIVPTMHAMLGTYAYADPGVAGGATALPGRRAVHGGAATDR